MCDAALQVPPQRLLPFDGFEQRLEIAFAKTLRAFALDNFKKQRRAIFDRLGEQLQQVAFVVAVYQNFQFAQQAGATHLVVHLVDYFKGGAHNPRDNQPTGTERGWGLAGDPNKLWSFGELLDLRKAVEAQGLKIEAIENFDPAHWHDVLLDGPKRKQQIENVKELIRRIGQAGIPVMGYNFSIAGVWGHVVGPWARGGAESVGFSRRR